MNLAIVGLPQAGKKSLFALLTGTCPAKAPTRDGIAYGLARVRDPRVDRLTQRYNPRRSRYAEFEVALPPAVRPDASRDADWLDPLRLSDAVIHVVRGFESDHVFHILGSVDPARDWDLVNVEFLLADLALVETRLERIRKTSPGKSDLSAERERAVLERCREHLEAERSLRHLGLAEEDLRCISSLRFLTLKPVMAALNVGEEQLGQATGALAALAARLGTDGAEVVFLSAAIEAELTELGEEDRAAFMADLGLTEPISHRLSRAAYACLGLISFFTVGPDEVRAWSVARGASAPEAAGKIHSDLERGFIRADTIQYDDLMSVDSEQAARQANLYRLNGKDYEVKDGDCLEIRFSV